MDPLIGGQKRSEGDEKSGGGQHSEARLRAAPENVLLPPTRSISRLCERCWPDMPIKSWLEFMYGTRVLFRSMLKKSYPYSLHHLIENCSILHIDPFVFPNLKNGLCCILSISFPSEKTTV